jgi:2-deoxy-D-gluconate 3-dehydrogenase
MASLPSAPVALVTGASAGLGYAIARGLAHAGYDLAVTDLASEMLAELVRDLAPFNRKILPVELDLRSETSIAAAFASVSHVFGCCDLLVNNAGRALVKPAAEVTWQEWDEVADVNLKGAFFLSQQMARYCLAAARPGAIVNIASTHGLTGLAGRAVYGASKGGLIQLTRMLAIEWAACGIRVNAVAPATVMTPSRATALSDPHTREQMLTRIPTGRFPGPEEVAQAVVYLAGRDAASITGHVLVLDGGLTAA